MFALSPPEMDKRVVDGLKEAPKFIWKASCWGTLEADKRMPRVGKYSMSLNKRKCLLNIGGG